MKRSNLLWEIKGRGARPVEGCVTWTHGLNTQSRAFPPRRETGRVNGLKLTSLIIVCVFWCYRTRAPFNPVHCHRLTLYFDWTVIVYKQFFCIIRNYETFQACSARVPLCFYLPHKLANTSWPDCSAVYSCAYRGRKVLSKSELNNCRNNPLEINRLKGCIKIPAQYWIKNLIKSREDLSATCAKLISYYQWCNRNTAV